MKRYAMLVAAMMAMACGGTEHLAATTATAAAPISATLPVWYFAEPGCQGAVITPCYYGATLQPVPVDTTVRSLSSVDGQCFDVAEKSVLACPRAL